MKVNLNMMERAQLLQIMPSEGNRFNRKIVRKALDSISYSEAELKVLGAYYEYACPSNTSDGKGRMVLCDNTGFFAEPPTCGKHNLAMMPTGNLHIPPSPLLYSECKDIHLGDEALRVIHERFEILNGGEKLTDVLIALEAKIFPPEEREKE